AGAERMKTRVHLRRAPARARPAPLQGVVRRSSAGAQAVRSIVQSPVPAGGAPLPAPVRAHMEPRLGADLGDVRVHTNGAAADSAAALHAHAYTFGRDVVFGAGAYSPDSAAGRRLIAHELAHVVQQRGGAPTRVQRQVDPNYVVDDPFV